MNNNSAKPKILLLMSATGGGHKASAEALKAGFESLYPNRFQIDIDDLLFAGLPRPFNHLPKTYQFLANDAPWAWKALWHTNQYPWAVHRFMQSVARLTERKVRQLFLRYNPDLLISVHPLVHEMSFQVLDDLHWRRPFATVVTDLADIHPLWFHRRVTACYVASEQAQQQALQAGLSPEQVHQFGLPVRPAFARPTQNKAELRQRLGLRPDLPAVLVMGGGDGIGPVAEIAQQVAARLSQITAAGEPLGQMVVVAGRNQRLLQQLQDIPWPTPTYINGFVPNMAEWMSACDCIITKAGPGTIAEATICGLPLILSGYIPGQEEGNVAYVIEHGAGVYKPAPTDIAATVARWFARDAQALPEMAARVRRIGRPRATFQIVESLTALLESAAYRSMNLGLATLLSLAAQ